MTGNSIPEITRSTLDLGGLRTSYLSAGDPAAPTVVLLHDGAWGGSAQASWGHVIPVMATAYRVIAPDLYGYGQSSKMVQLDVAPYEFRLRQVCGLLDSIGLGDTSVHFVGNSFGGAMALRAATLPWMSWRVRSATSISGTGGPYRTPESLISLSHFDGTVQDMRRIVELLTGEFDGIDDQVAVRMRDAIDVGHYRAVAAAGLTVPFAVERTFIDRYPEELAEVRMPVALVRGINDDLVDADWAEKIAQHSSRCSVYSLDTRHSPNISDPTATATLLLEIVSAVEESGRGRAGYV